MSPSTAVTVAERRYTPIYRFIAAFQPIFRSDPKFSSNNRSTTEQRNRNHRSHSEMPVPEEKRRSGEPCSDGLPRLIASGDQRHRGEFITPGILFFYIAGWIRWVGRRYLIAIRDEKKPTQKEIIIDVSLANKLIWRGFCWPVAAYREYLNGKLIDPNV